jgi:hypothetical protein
MNKLLTMISAVALLPAIAGPAHADPIEKTVFVTSAKFKGNLGGLTGADAKCQAEADGPATIVPSGTYLAWLSDGTDSPDTRFTKSSHPYVLPDGTKIAEDFTDLTDGSLLQKINIDPTGKALGMQLFWTGTKSDGTTYQLFVTCAGWTGDTWPGANGQVGSTIQTGTLWSSYQHDRCKRSHKLACFQQ